MTQMNEKETQKIHFPYSQPVDHIVRQHIVHLDLKNNLSLVFLLYA